MMALMDGETDVVASIPSSGQVVANGNGIIQDDADIHNGDKNIDAVAKSISEVETLPEEKDERCANPIPPNDHVHGHGRAEGEVETCPPSTMPGNNDHVQIHPRAQTMARNFETEHRIFLRAILDLLAERDQLAMEAAVNSNETIKIGPLRKASRRIKGLWKTKYVEIRRGTFSYYDDNAKPREGVDGREEGYRKLLRKDVPLKASSCTCRAVKMRSVKKGAVFEIRIQDPAAGHKTNRRLWMANSHEERLAWIEAIHKSMVGVSVTRGSKFWEYEVEHGEGSNLPSDSPYRSFSEQYLAVRGGAHRAGSKHEFLGALSPLRGKTIAVPVHWIRSQLADTPAHTTFVESDIASSVNQMWKDLLRDAVEINGEVLTGDSFHGPDRIMGKLTQQILSSECNQNRITAAQAVSYSRDILLASDRTRSGGDSYFSAENLCLNRGLVVLCPSSTEATPISIKVSGHRRKSTVENGVSGISGWALVQTSPKKRQRQYLVLSGCELSFYAKAEPEPHKLLDWIVMEGAKVAMSPMACKNSASTASLDTTDRSVHISFEDGRVVHELLFEDEVNFSSWYDSLEQSTQPSVGCITQENQSTDKMNGFRGASDATVVGIESPVDVTLNVSTEYKMCTIDPSGVESDDTWAELRTTFIQKFSLTGGPDGGISRGDEIVEIEML
ncbi:hypothetical protein ACHAWF_006725 [Thalassiosira exigua]